MPLRLIVAFALALVPAFARADAPGDDFFLPAKVWEFHLTISAKEYAAMQAPAGAMPMFGAPPRPPAPKPKPGEDVREVHRNTFGVDQPWAKGAVTAEGKTFDNVGLRYKGNGTFLESGQGLKKSLKIDLDRHVAEHRYHGLKTLNLHSGVADPSKCRETLAYAAYRNCGVPSPRTTLAEVFLTVPGKFDKELLGVFTVVEQVDAAFLRTHFKTDKGLLMKPERMLGLDFLGDDWSRYTNYEPKREATVAEQKRLIEFTRLVNRADDETFNREIGNYLDVDGFLRFMAVSSLVVSLDSFFTLGHNYYLYLHPETHKFHFFPWDLDRSLANFGIFGTNDQQMDLSLTQPYAGPQRLADRIRAMKGVPERYKAIVKELTATGFTRERLSAELKAVEAATKEPMAREEKAIQARRETNTNPLAAGGFLGSPPPLATFIDKRLASVEGQLAGTRKGHVPTAFGFGPPPPGTQLARPLLAALDASKDGQLTEEEILAGMRRLFVEWDKDRNGVLDQEEMAAGLQRLMPPPPGPGGPKK